jgi:molybdopterin-containing oxidoreductase family iron-sulfur binding subunit
VESCTFCVHRVDASRTPACVEACKAENHNAMIFGDMNDPASDISKQLKKYNSRQIRADLELNTGVRYRGI